MPVPKVQRAAIVPSPGSGATLEVQTNYPVKQPSELAPGECLLKMHSTGVCHTDLHAKQGDWPVPPKTPLIGGHEGVGEVVAIGKNTENITIKVGDRVGVKWLADSCLNCEYCRKGKEMNCSKAKLSGYTVDGTFSEYVVSYVNHVTPIPKELPSDEAASILCAGVTVYSAIKAAKLNMGEYLVIPGAGGGLGHLAVQYAVARGLRVIAIDTGDDKKKLCSQLGAEAWIDFKTTKDMTKAVHDLTGGEGAHAVMCVSAKGEAYDQSIEYLRPTGTLVAVGLPADAYMKANVFWTVFKSLSIVGSYVGSRQDAIEALAIAAAGKVKVHFSGKPLDALKRVYEDLETGKIAGRIVLNF